MPIAVTLTVEQNGAPIGEKTGCRAWNGAIRASEELVRQHARRAGCAYEGDPPVREGDVYTRLWHACAPGKLPLLAKVVRTT